MSIRSIALSLHTLYSQYRGPVILNMADAPAEPTKEAPKEAPKEEPKEAPKPENSAEERVKKALEKAKNAEERAKALEDAEKKRQEDEALKRGEHEKLLKQKDEELGKLKGDHESASKTLESYEKAAKDQVEKKLEAVKDAKKKESILKLLEGRPVLEQFALVDEAITLAGAGGDFGSPTPASLDTQSKETKKKRYAELLAKSDPTPSERAERHKLMFELSDVMQEKKAS